MFVDNVIRSRGSRPPFSIISTRLPALTSLQAAAAPPAPLPTTIMSQLSGIHLLSSPRLVARMRPAAVGFSIRMGVSARCPACAQENELLAQLRAARKRSTAV
jgi:hypothetical protein